MQKLLVLLLVLLFMQQCSNSGDVINTNNIKAIVIYLGDSQQKTSLNMIEISNKDSLNLILKELNRGEREPIKFFPTHRLKLIYEGEQEKMIFFSGTSMKYDSLTYRLKRRILDIVGY